MPETAPTGGAPAERLIQAVELAHRHARLDVAFAAALAQGRPQVVAAAGDQALLTADLVPRLCRALTAGELPTLMPALDAFDGTAPPGTWLGVPLRYADGSVYGVLACFGRRTGRPLDQTDVEFLDYLAGTVTAELTHARRRLRWREELCEVIDREDLSIACQPIIDLREERVAGLEGLARFSGGLRPDEAFAAARELGLGVELEALAIRQALDVLPHLSANQYLSINVSPGVALRLAREGEDLDRLPFRRVVLELTENTAVDSYPELRSELDPLRLKGLRLAIDDAGAGYSSMRHIVEFRPDFIKVDRSLVQGVAADRARRMAISSFVLLALDSGAKTVAEGVETYDDLSALLDLGIDAAQGYLLGRPSSDPTCIAGWSRSARTPVTCTPLSRAT